MKYDILHEIPGRIRVCCRDVHMTHKNAEAIEEILSTLDGVISVHVSVRTGNLLLQYTHITPRRHALAYLDVLEPSDWEGFDRTGGQDRPRLFEIAITGILKELAKTVLKLIFLPAPARYALILFDSLPYVAKGLNTLIGGKMDVSVLDASALSILSLRRDFGAIRTILWMFQAADALEEWTRVESRKGLAEALAVKVDAVWLETPNGEVRRPLSEVKPGDIVVIGTGSVIPVDGIIARGEAMVNQSVLTGESAAVHKTVNLSVFAGTVVDEGRISIRVTKKADDTRLNGIIKFIEESELVKAGVQSRSEKMADRIVPYTLLFSLGVLLITRNPIRASAVLMVDYSCAIRMSTPLTLLNAIQEGVRRGVLVKGGKYLENLAGADSLALDKTGTLTKARPRVARVVAFEGWSRDEVLRVAACIEEHFPHPVGRAVVRQAEEENLSHRERHAKPEYILAHGITSHIDGKRIAVGSLHFIAEDMNVALNQEAGAIALEEAGEGRSLLYMAFDGKLVGMIAIEDPIRADAGDTLKAFALDGIDDVHMLTGDGLPTARAVAEALGIKSIHANMLPENKAAIIKELRAAGHKVMFVGDGVNDSPALSAADVGVSLKDGADIAREVAGVVLIDGNLSDLVIARRLARAALARNELQFGFIVSLNTILIGLGLFAAISPRIAALLHNLGTVLVTMNSIKKLLPELDVIDATTQFPEIAHDGEAEGEEEEEGFETIPLVEYSGNA